MSNHLKSQQLDWDERWWTLTRKGTKSQANWPKAAGGDTAQAAANQSHQHVGTFLGHIRLKPRLPPLHGAWPRKIYKDKKNRAVQWFGPRCGSVVLNTLVASNNNPREWMISVLIFQFCLKLYNLDFTCCPCPQEHCLFCQAHWHHWTACHLLNSAQSTEIVREQGVQERWYKLLQDNRKHDWTRQAGNKEQHDSL